MSLARSVAARLFDIVAAIGRPYGGIRPRRIALQLSQFAYGNGPPSENKFRWYTDRYGIKMKLHPYYLIDRDIIAFGGYELPLQRFIQNRVQSGMVCLDVGANIGAVALHLAKCAGNCGKVYGFEPVPANADRLRKNIAENEYEERLQVIEQALSDADATLELAVATTANVNQGMGSLVEMGHTGLTERIQVQSVRLDSFCATHAIKKVDFIKVDIQGAEPLFLEGAQQTLRTYRPILIMEVAPSSLSSSGYSSKDLLAQMESLGYSARTLKSSGDPGVRLTAAECSPTFTAENVLFEHE